MLKTAGNVYIKTNEGGEGVFVESDSSININANANCAIILI